MTFNEKELALQTIDAVITSERQDVLNHKMGARRAALAAARESDASEEEIADIIRRSSYTPTFVEQEKDE